ncbi:MAG: class I SAM-dependent methyltransferase [Candidatus Aminicenantes bacterium]|jgi:16S rRNA (guanine(527)-N(7))-methyltransferase RsmG
MELQDTLKTYIDMLLEYNEKVNLISRKITSEKLDKLLSETHLLNLYISNDIIIDAGSGNGLLGIPIALMDKNRRLILVEPKRKKALFLMEVKKRMELSNVDVRDVSIEECLKKPKNWNGKSKTLIARGFPRLHALCGFVHRGLISEAVLITSENKIKKNQNDLESVTKKTYNIPMRKNLRILKILRRSI